MAQPRNRKARPRRRYQAAPGREAAAAVVPAPQSTRVPHLGPQPLGMEAAAAPEGAVRGSGAWREPAEPITEQELHEELRRARDDYNMATGTGQASRAHPHPPFLLTPLCSD